MKSLKLISLCITALILLSACAQETAIKDRDLLFENVTNSSSFQAYYDDHKTRKEILTRFKLSDIITAEYPSEEERLKAMDQKIKFSQEASALFEKLASFQSRKVNNSSNEGDMLQDNIKFIKTQDVSTEVQELAIDLIRHDASQDTHQLANRVLEDFPSLTRMDLLEITRRYDAKKEQGSHSPQAY